MMMARRVQISKVKRGNLQRAPKKKAKIPKRVPRSLGEVILKLNFTSTTVILWEITSECSFTTLR